MQCHPVAPKSHPISGSSRMVATEPNHAHVAVRSAALSIRCMELLMVAGYLIVTPSRVYLPLNLSI